MPKPHPIRSAFLNYLRTSYGQGMPWVDPVGVYLDMDVRGAIKKLARTDPIHHKILDHYMRSKAPRIRIADVVNYDSSTVKRKLDEAVDIILQNLHTSSGPEGLISGQA